MERRAERQPTPQKRVFSITHRANIVNSIGEEGRELRRKNALKRWEDPEFRKKTSLASSEGLKRKWKEDPEFRRKSSEASSRRMKALWNNPEYKKRVSESQRKRWEDPEYRKSREEGYVDKELWLEARKTGLLDKIVSENMLQLSEVSSLSDYFSRKTKKTKKVEEIIEKFSIALARVA